MNAELFIGLLSILSVVLLLLTIRAAKTHTGLWIAPPVIIALIAMLWISVNDIKDSPIHARPAGDWTYQHHLRYDRTIYLWATELDHPYPRTYIFELKDKKEGQSLDKAGRLSANNEPRVYNFDQSLDGAMTERDPAPLPEKN